jgi:hypothetical protein
MATVNNPTMTQYNSCLPAPTFSPCETSLHVFVFALANVYIHTAHYLCDLNIRTQHYLITSLREVQGVQQCPGNPSSPSRSITLNFSFSYLYSTYTTLHPQLVTFKHGMISKHQKCQAQEKPPKVLKHLVVSRISAILSTRC